MIELFYYTKKMTKPMLNSKRLNSQRLKRKEAKAHKNIHNLIKQFSNKKQNRKKFSSNFMKLKYQD